jgi:thiamine-phosphate diphosphorylase
MSAKLSGFYFITDPALSKNGIVSDVRAAVAGGSRIIQYRAKGALFEQTWSSSKELLAITRNAGAQLIINDYPLICQKTGADGVHLGQSDARLEEARKLLGGKIIGVSVASVAKAVSAEKGGADYLGVGPIFPTTTKKDAAKPIGIAGLRQIRRATRIPIVAIGGITLKNAPEAIGAGADGICAISATAGENVEGKVRAFAGLFPSGKNPAQFNLI